MNQLLGCLLTGGCLGMSWFMAMPSVAQTTVESNKSIGTVSSVKNLQANFESDSKNTVIVAETEVADSSNFAEVVTSEASTRRPLPSRIFPATSMQQ